MFWTSVQVQKAILKLKPKLESDPKPSYQPNSNESREAVNIRGIDNKPLIEDQGDYRMVGGPLSRKHEMFY